MATDNLTPALPTQAEFVATLPTAIGVLSGSIPANTVMHALWIDLGYAGTQIVPGTKTVESTHHESTSKGHKHGAKEHEHEAKAVVTDKQLIEQLKAYHTNAQSKMMSTETPSAVDWIAFIQKLLVLLFGG